MSTPRKNVGFCRLIEQVAGQTARSGLRHRERGKAPPWHKAACAMRSTSARVGQALTIKPVEESGSFSGSAPPGPAICIDRSPPCRRDWVCQDRH